MTQMPARRHRRAPYVPSLPAFNRTPRADDDELPLLGDAQQLHHRTSRMSRTGNARGRPPGRASLLPSSHAGEGGDGSYAACVVVVRINAVSLRTSISASIVRFAFAIVIEACDSFCAN